MMIIKKVLILLVIIFYTLTTHGITLKIATLAPDGTSWMREMRLAATQIEEKTEGRVKLKFYPGGVMGDTATVLRKMRIGQLNGGMFIAGDFNQIFPDVLLYTLPFLFNSEKEINYVRERMDDDLKAGFKQKGYTVLGITGGGFAYLMSDEALQKKEDLSGKKIWVPEGDPVAYESFRAAGISPIPLGIPDVYTALQTGSIDTIINTPTGVIALQWHTKISYFIDIPLTYVVGLMAVDNKSFDKINEDDRRILLKTIEDGFQKIDEFTQEENEKAREVLKKESIKFITVSDDEKLKWKDIANIAIKTQQKKDYFTQARLDEMKRLIAEYRQQNGSLN